MMGILSDLFDFFVTGFLTQKPAKKYRNGTKQQNVYIGNKGSGKHDHVYYDPLRQREGHVGEDAPRNRRKR